MQPTQLDIFADSRDTMLRNDVVRALENRDAAAAQRALAGLQSDYPADAWVEPLQRLVHHVSRGARAGFVDPAELQAACADLTHDVVPAAQRVFGADAAGPWVAPSWRELASCAGRLRFDPSHAFGHAAPLWLEAGDAAAAEQAVGSIESWRRIPAPLGWMAEARCRLADLDAAWPLLVELAWLAPERFGAVAARLNHRVIERLLARFDAEFEGEGAAIDRVWFPAWALVHDNHLAPVLALAESGLHGRAERTFRAVLGLLTLERRGAHHDLVEARRAFRELHGGLYAAYMQTR
jgi:hypothetical protein